MTRLSDAGVADPVETDGDPVNGHSMANTGKTVLRVRNDSTDTLTLTLVTPITVGGKAVEDTDAEIPAGTTRTFGSLPPALYGTSLAINAGADLKLLAFEP
ncbi:hypothetical protein [Streptomyces corynorhini]|uniref:Uncharacterized protein n=1 Tax=Streptomyces corynorhini TaxID=2282652 RepID=A0A370B812_9ACTN|nr:hypothetical protein [Streptomyces corynorhini]RDG37948.1 hypothetical protein DVH02_11535 [Streptomyces corynorhini]